MISSALLSTALYDPISLSSIPYQTFYWSHPNGDVVKPSSAHSQNLIPFHTSFVNFRFYEPCNCDVCHLAQYSILIIMSSLFEKISKKASKTNSIFSPNFSMLWNCFSILDHLWFPLVIFSFIFHKPSNSVTYRYVVSTLWEYLSTNMPKYALKDHIIEEAGRVKKMFKKFWFFPLK